MMTADDLLRFAWPHFLKTKSDVSAVLGRFLTDIRAHGNLCAVECLHSDNGTEFTKQEFVTLLGHHGIRHEYTSIDPPKHNSVAARGIVMTLELAMGSCPEPPRLFGGVPLPPTGLLWAEVCVYACDALNMMARVGDKADKLSPYQKFHGKPPFPRLQARVPPRETNAKIGGKDTGVLLPERWQPPLG